MSETLRGRRYDDLAFVAVAATDGEDGEVTYRRERRVQARDLAEVRQATQESERERRKAGGPR